MVMAGASARRETYADRHGCGMLRAVVRVTGGPRNDLRPPGRACAEYSVVQHQIDPRSWGDRRQPLEQLDGVEHEMRRAIRPTPWQLKKHLTRRRQSEAIGGDRRAQGVPADPLESVSMPGWNPHGGLEVEAVLPRVTRAERPPVGLLWQIPAPADPASRPRPERDPPLD